jgi:hypothetical protein
MFDLVVILKEFDFLCLILSSSSRNLIFYVCFYRQLQRICIFMFAFVVNFKEFDFLCLLLSSTSKNLIFQVALIVNIIVFIFFISCYKILFSPCSLFPPIWPLYSASLVNLCQRRTNFPPINIQKYNNFVLLKYESKI